MKVLLELLSDAANVLDNLEGAGEMRPATRRRIRGLLKRLSNQSDRLLEAIEPPEEAVGQTTGETATDASKHPTGSDAAQTSGDDSEAASKRSTLMQRGLAALARNRFDDARAVFAEAVAEFPKDVELLNHLALTCWEQGDFESAEGWYAQAMEAGLADIETGAGNDCGAPSRDYLRAIEGRALCLYRLDDHDEAVRLFASLATLSPADHGSCRYLAGEIRHLQGRLEDAIEHYRQAPREPSVCYNLGLAHWQRGCQERAATMWIRGFVSNPHIAARLLNVSVTSAEASGYVGSSGYADEYLEACEPLWDQAAGAREFLAACWGHRSVTRFISNRRAPRERAEVSEEVVDAPDAESVDGDGEVRELARQILERPEGS